MVCVPDVNGYILLLHMHEALAEVPPTWICAGWFKAGLPFEGEYDTGNVGEGLPVLPPLLSNHQ